jgi:hypothetical protein
LAIGLFCLNPPGDLYKNLGAKTDTVMLDSAFNWDSPISSPQFNEGYFTFHEIEYSKAIEIFTNFNDNYQPTSKLVLN